MGANRVCQIVLAALVAITTFTNPTTAAVINYDEAVSGDLAVTSPTAMAITHFNFDVGINKVSGSQGFADSQNNILDFDSFFFTIPASGRLTSVTFHHSLTQLSSTRACRCRTNPDNRYSVLAIYGIYDVGRITPIARPETVTILSGNIFPIVPTQLSGPISLFQPNPIGLQLPLGPGKYQFGHIGLGSTQNTATWDYSLSFDVQSTKAPEEQRVPEPKPIWLLAFGLVGGTLWMRRRPMNWPSRGRKSMWPS